MKNGFGMPKKRVDALDVEDQAEDRAEEVGADGGPERAPLGEDDEADRDPAATADGLVAEPAGREASVMVAPARPASSPPTKT